MLIQPTLATSGVYSITSTLQGIPTSGVAGDILQFQIQHAFITHIYVKHSTVDIPFRQIADSATQQTIVFVMPSTDIEIVWAQYNEE